MARKDDLQILVVGAGIGGLCLTRSLRRSGYNPVLIDGAGHFDDAGHGMTICTSGLSLLADFEIVDDVLEVATPLTTWEMHGPGADLHTQISLDHQRDVPIVALHGVHVHRILRRSIPHKRIRLDTTIEHLVRQQDTIEVTFDDGVRERFDLVVGAEGADSSVRSAISPAEGEPSGESAFWSFWIDQYDEQPTVITDVWAQNDTVLTVIPHGDRSFATLSTTPVPPEHDQYSLPVLRRTFDESAWMAPEILDSLSSESIGYATTHRPRAMEWGDGRIALLGQAADPVHPLSLSRTSLAIEDAVALSEELTAGKGGVVETLARYKARRNARRQSLRNDSAVRSYVTDLSSITPSFREGLAIRSNLIDGAHR